MSGLERYNWRKASSKDPTCAAPIGAVTDGNMWVNSARGVYQHAGIGAEVEFLTAEFSRYQTRGWHAWVADEKDPTLCHDCGVYPTVQRAMQACIAGHRKRQGLT